MSFVPLNLAKPTPSFQPLGATQPTPQKSGGFFSNVVGGAKTLIGDTVGSLFKSPTPVETGVFSTKTPSVGSDIALTALNSYSNTLNDAKNRMNEWSTIAKDNHATALQKGVAAGEAGMGALNIFLAPITAAIKGAEKIPALGIIATGINNIFSAVGTGFADIGEGTLQALPISQQSKDQAMPLVKEVFALGGQIALGKVGGDVFDKMTEKSKQLIDTIQKGTPKEVATTVPETSKPTPSFVPIKPLEAPISPESAPTGVQTDLTGKPSYKSVATNLPDTGISLPSLSSTADIVDLSTRYKSPSHLTVTSISDYVTKSRASSQANVDPFTVDIQKATGITPDVRVKSAESIAGKAERFNLKGKPLSSMGDVLAGRLTVKEGDLQSTIDKVKQNFKVVEVDDYRNSPTDFGYRGTNIKVELPNKMIAEIQVHTPESLAHANFSHSIYEKYRNVDTSKFTPEQIAQMNRDINTSKNKMTKPAEVKTEPIAGAPKPIETVGEQQASRVFERIQAENPQIEGQVGYDPIKLKEDAQKAVDLVAKDKQQAYRIAMGAETSPEVTSTAVNIAMSEKAIADGNYELAGRLIKNRSLEQTRRGQEIVSERGSVTDNSASKYIKELVASRLDALGKTYLSGLKILKRVADKTKALEKIGKEVAKVEEQIKGKKLDVKTALALLDKLACV